MHICAFIGHSFVYSASVENHLKDVIEDFLSGIDEATFYVGGRGEFDSLATTAVREAKAV